MRHFRLIKPHIPNPQNPNFQFLGFFNQPFSTTAPPPPKITAIADEITNLTLLEVADLTTLLSKKLEIKEMPLVSLMMPGMGFSLRGIGGGSGGAGVAKVAEEVVEKTAFDLRLESGFDTSAKIKIIKEVRTFTELGLKEAKELVEKAPAVLKSGVSKEEAERIVEKLKAVGATVVLV